MSTRSFVGLLHKNDRIEYIYVHFDGNIEGVGTELITNHNSVDAAQRLVNLGDRETLTNGEDRFYDETDDEWEKTPRQADCWDDLRTGAARMINYVYLWDEQQEKWIVITADNFDKKEMHYLNLEAEVNKF